ncbi:MAG: hypothetical protein P1V51_03845 [Deltaproteobacteria bacterium]|nr:hypothetical protein [Deltaproteobacteria bacterium]
MDSEGPGRFRGLRVWAGGLGVFLILALQVWSQTAPLDQGELCTHIDTAGHWARALDCAEGRGCSLSLGRLSRLDLAHGAAALHLMSGLAVLGGELEDVAYLAAALYLLALFALYLLGARLQEPLAGLLAAELCLLAAGSSMITGLSVLWNPVFLPPFVVLALAAGVLFLETRRLRHLLLVAFFLSWVAQTHLAGLALLPFGVWLASRLPPRRWLAALLLSLGVVLLTFLLGSPASLAQLDPGGSGPAAATDARGLEGAHLLLFGLCALAGLDLLWRRRGSAGEATPGRALALALLVTHLPLALLAGLSSTGDARYLLPLVPGLALLAALRLSHFFARIPTRLRGIPLARIALGVGVGVLTLVALQRYQPSLEAQPKLTPLCVRPADGRALARLLREELDWDFEDALWRLRGARRADLWLAALSTEPLGQPGEEGIVDLDLQIVRLPPGARAQLPAGWIDLRPDAPAREPTFGVQVHRSILDRGAPEICGIGAAPPGDPLACAPGGGTLSARLSIAAPPEPYLARELASIAPPGEDPIDRIRYRVKLRPEVREPRRLLLEPVEFHGCVTQVLGATGAHLEVLSAGEVILHPADPEGEAHLYLSRALEGCDSRFFGTPALLEWPADRPSAEARALYPEPADAAEAAPLVSLSLVPGLELAAAPRRPAMRTRPVPAADATLPLRTPFVYVAFLLLGLGLVTAWTLGELIRSSGPGSPRSPSRRDPSPADRPAPPPAC